MGLVRPPAWSTNCLICHRAAWKQIKYRRLCQCHMSPTATWQVEDYHQKLKTGSVQLVNRRVCFAVARKQVNEPWMRTEWQGCGADGAGGRTAGGGTAESITQSITTWYSVTENCPLHKSLCVSPTHGRCFLFYFLGFIKLAAKICSTFYFGVKILRSVLVI